MDGGYQLHIQLLCLKGKSPCYMFDERLYGPSASLDAMENVYMNICFFSQEFMNGHTV